MYHKMLVPLDGSPSGECVLEHVIGLARGCKITDVTLIYVIEPFNPAVYETTPAFIAQVQEAAVSSASDYLSGIVARLKTAGITAKPVIVKGRAADSILEYTASNQVDLIAMSTHGRSGITRWLLGSVADKVAHGASAMVFLAPPAGCRTD